MAIKVLVFSLRSRNIHACLTQLYQSYTISTPLGAYTPIADTIISGAIELKLSLTRYPFPPGSRWCTFVVRSLPKAVSELKEWCQRGSNSQPVDLESDSITAPLYSTAVCHCTPQIIKTDILTLNVNNCTHITSYIFPKQ